MTTMVLVWPRFDAGVALIGFGCLTLNRHGDIITRKTYASRMRIGH